MAQRHIAIIAPPWYPIPPVGYGGIELVVYLLVQGLRERGVNVTLLASEGSLPGSIVLAPSEWSADLGRVNGVCREVTYVSRVVTALEQLNDVDLIHDHAGWVSLLASSMTGIAPVIHTVHGPLYEPQQTVYRDLGTRAGLVAISEAQRSSDPSLNWVGTVHNAVDIDSLWPASRTDKDHYVLCLARITPEKGQHIAIEVAKRCGYRLILAGKVGEQQHEMQYFEELVKPHIDNDRVIWFPNIAGQQKADILARATALLSPICWPEPFGLAMVEAMVSGTPVLALDQGAAPELVTAGVTGHVVSTADEMVECLSSIDDIDPLECAAASRSEFSAQALADKYMAVYDRVIAEAAETAPTAKIFGRTTAVRPDLAAESVS